MINTKQAKGYDYYPERIAQIVLSHELIFPDEKSDFERYVRGY